MNDCSLPIAPVASTIRELDFFEFQLAYNGRGLAMWRGSPCSSRLVTSLDKDKLDEYYLLLQRIDPAETKPDQRTSRSEYVHQPAILPNPMLSAVIYSVMPLPIIKATQRLGTIQKIDS